MRHVVGVEPVDADAERREEHRAFDALLVHRAQPRVAVAVLVGERLELPELLHRVHVAPVAVLGELLQPGVVGAGLADRVERRVRDRRGDHVAEHEPALLALRHPPHEALHLVVAVAGEGVLGLVVVVVEVDEPVVERGHGRPPSSGESAKTLGVFEGNATGSVRAPLSDGQVQVPRAADLVAERIRELIVTGQLADGERLPSLDGLLAEFGISGPTMREALRMLESEGLITVQRGKVGGAIVHRPSYTDAATTMALVLRSRDTEIADVARSLAVLERQCAVLCARRADRGPRSSPRCRS